MRILSSSRTSSGSEPTRSEPPPASSWAAPPEFYLDECVGQSVRRLLLGLDYVVHTPAEVFGTRLDAAGVLDTVWLAKLARSGWLVLSRDAKITQRPDELAAYRAAALHLFLLPGEALAAELRQLTADNLATICTRGAQRTPGVWRITTSGVRLLRI